ncbi:MAG: CDP-alcohol phosphatidyltransferase family protein [Acidobacteriota bacterium]|nr:CDP-alcohol phosphatidyltransferase family protein [Acidobacteriota bacterium]
MGNSTPSRPFVSAIREHHSVLAAAEKRALIAIASRIPARINSDHLTGLGALAMAGAGAAFWIAPHWPPALALVVVFLGLNWFGDSLDGTLARVRRHERPRYGFYLDHVLDAAGILVLLTGLALSGFIGPVAMLAFLVAYYLLSIEVYLATHALGRFHMSFWGLGPTELRILLAIGTVKLFWGPDVTIMGYAMRMFDLGAWIGAAGLLVTAIVAAAKHTRELYLAEPLPRASAAELSLTMRK